MKNDSKAMMMVNEAAENVYNFYATHDNIWAKVGDKLHSELVSNVRKHIDDTIIPAFEMAMNCAEPETLEQWQKVIVGVNETLIKANKQIREIFFKILKVLEPMVMG